MNNDNNRFPRVYVGGDITVGGKVNIGGSLTNTISGKIKIGPNGELNVAKDAINSGDLLIDDPERIKQLLIEVVKTSGSLAELGSRILETFFKS